MARAAPHPKPGPAAGLTLTPPTTHPLFALPEVTPEKHSASGPPCPGPGFTSGSLGWLSSPPKARAPAWAHHQGQPPGQGQEIEVPQGLGQSQKGTPSSRSRTSDLRMAVQGSLQSSALPAELSKEAWGLHTSHTHHSLIKTFTSHTTPAYMHDSPHSRNKEPLALEHIARSLSRPWHQSRADTAMAAHSKPVSRTEGTSILVRQAQLHGRKSLHRPAW